jgi:enterochelin esterase-like enzyme
VPGQRQEVVVAGRGLGAEVHADVWSPADSGPGEPLPLLVAHDGPEYDRLAALTHFAAAGIASRALPRHRIALLAPTERNEWYSASARYAGALVRDVVPALRSAVAVDGPVVGMGASLGGLAMLHAQRRHPGTFGGLFLQSGSFFTPQFDAQESGFPRYQRIVRFVRGTLREGVHADPVPVVLTCGSAEENAENNRLMARTLANQGYPVALHEVPDLHNYTAWRDAFEPHLTGLLARTW